MFSASALLLAAFQDALNVIFDTSRWNQEDPPASALFLFLLVLVFASTVLLSLILETVIASLAEAVRSRSGVRARGEL